MLMVLEMYGHESSTAIMNKKSQSHGFHLKILLPSRGGNGIRLKSAIIEFIAANIVSGQNW